MIPARRNRKEPRQHDRGMFGSRHRVENFLSRHWEFTAVATRCDTADESLEPEIHLVAGAIAST